MILTALIPLLAAHAVSTAAYPPSSPELGRAEARCRANEEGPAILVEVVGLKDRVGRLKLEVYPSNDDDFLQDDSILVGQGKTFRRAEGPVILCSRIPGPGPYSVSLLHDRDGNHKFGMSVDGIGFAGNPRLGWFKPKAASTRLVAGNGLTRTAIVLNYRRGLHMAPLRDNN